MLNGWTEKVRRPLSVTLFALNFARGQTTIRCFAFSRDLACSILWKINRSELECFPHAALAISNKCNVRWAWERKNCTLLMANAVMMSDSLCMMRAFPPGQLRSDSICISEWKWAHRQTHTSPCHHTTSTHLMLHLWPQKYFTLRHKSSENPFNRGIKHYWYSVYYLQCMRPQLLAEAYFTPALKQQTLAKTTSYRSLWDVCGLDCSFTFSTEMLHSDVSLTCG